jgi:phenylacetic acid degradation operon negative regulatory protein
LQHVVSTRNIESVKATAKTLDVVLVAPLRSGSMPVRALIAAGELFGIDANALRVALARLVSAGLVESDERGAYRLGAAAGSVSAHVGSWRTIEDRVRTWDGAWVGVLLTSIPRAARARVRSTERALRFLGFRHLDRGLAVRPDNLKGSVAAVRERLASLGLDPHAAVFSVQDLDSKADARARTLWRDEHLERKYRDLLEAVERSSARLPELPQKRAMAESFLVGGATIRALVLDPLLPEPMAPVAERRALVAAMRDYDRLGREHWSAFMKEHGSPYLRAPHDVRAGDRDWASAHGLSGATT